LCVERGLLRVAVNFSAEYAEVDLGLTGPAEFVAAWTPCSPPDAYGLLRLPGHSAAVLRLG
jgi:maltooligosyltrehalose trehalohydrolase